MPVSWLYVGAGWGAARGSRPGRIPDCHQRGISPSRSEGRLVGRFRLHQSRSQRGTAGSLYRRPADAVRSSDAGGEGDDRPHLKGNPSEQEGERKSVVMGKNVYVRGDHGGGRNLKK